MISYESEKSSHPNTSNQNNRRNEIENVGENEISALLRTHFTQLLNRFCRAIY